MLTQWIDPRYGRTVRTHDGKDDPMVLLLVHEVVVPSQQQSLYLLLERILEADPSVPILLEGHGPEQALSAGRMSGREQRVAAALAMLGDEGCLASDVAMEVHPDRARLLGIEDTALLEAEQEQLRIFEQEVRRRFPESSARQMARTAIRELKPILEDIEDSVSTPGLRDLLGLRRQEGENLTLRTVGTHMRSLADLAQRARVDCECYPSFMALTQAVALERMVDFGRSQQQRTELTTEIVSVLRDRERIERLEASLEGWLGSTDSRASGAALEDRYAKIAGYAPRPARPAEGTGWRARWQRFMGWARRERDEALGPRVERRLVALSLATQVHEIDAVSYYALLNDLLECLGISLDPDHHFGRYLRYVALAAKIDGDQLMSHEVPALIDRLAATFATRDSNEIEVYRLRPQLLEIEQLIELRLPAASASRAIQDVSIPGVTEWLSRTASANREIQDVISLRITKWLFHTVRLAAEMLPASRQGSSLAAKPEVVAAVTLIGILEPLALSYYRHALRRVERLADNAAAAILRQPGASALVCSRFSVTAIERALERAGIGYIVVQPMQDPTYVDGKRGMLQFQHWGWFHRSAEYSLAHRVAPRSAASTTTTSLAALLRTEVDAARAAMAESNARSAIRSELEAARKVLLDAGARAADPAYAREFLERTRKTLEARDQDGGTGWPDERRRLIELLEGVLVRAREIGVVYAFREADQDRAIEGFALPLERYLAGSMLEDLTAAEVAWDAFVNPPPDSLASARLVEIFRIGREIYKQLFQALGEDAHLLKSIALAERVIQLSTGASAEDAVHRAQLGLLLCTRYRRVAEDDCLERGLAYLEQAVELASDSSSACAECRACLSIGLQVKYERSGRPELVDRAIALCVAEDRSMPISMPARADVPTALGRALMLKYARSGDLIDLEQAQSTLELARSLTPERSPDYPARLFDLGRALTNRYARLPDRDDGVRAHVHLWNAASTTPEHSPERSSRLAALGELLVLLYANEGSREDLTSALVILQKAVPDSSSIEQRVIINSMCSGLKVRYERTRRPEDLKQAIELLEQVLESIPRGVPHRAAVLCSLADLMVKREPAASADRVRACYREASQLGLKLGMESALRAARNWGKWEFEQREWKNANDAFRLALKAIDELVTIQAVRYGKESWLREAEMVPGLAAYASIMLGGEASTPEATLIIEGGRARLLGESLERNQADIELLRERSPAVYERYRDAAEWLARLEAAELGVGPSGRERRSPEDLSAARTALAQAVASVRTVSGYESFLQPLQFDGIVSVLNQLPSGTCLVYLVTTAAGSLAIMLSANRAACARTEFASNHLDELLARNENLSDADLVLGFLREQAFLSKDLDAALDVLGRALIAPVASCLRDMCARYAVLIPTGRLALLPLHAASYERDGASVRFQDEFVVSFAPNVKILSAAQEALRRRTHPRSLMAIGNPLPSSHSLRAAIAEVQEIAGWFPREQRVLLCEHMATREAVLDKMPTATHLHFACHGHFDARNPLESGLALSGGQTLTLRDLLAGATLPVRSRLAVLSACQTALTDVHKLPDEFIGMPAGFLQAGVPGVIGTLWPVDDFITAVLMTKFYELYWAIEDTNPREPLNPAKALRDSQTWLRTAPAEAFADYCTSHLHLGTARRRRAGRRPPSPVATDDESPGRARETEHRPPRRDVISWESHAVAASADWAAFVFVGV
jgi:CHAT domain-containing protein